MTCTLIHDEIDDWNGLGWDGWMAGLTFGRYYLDKKVIWLYKELCSTTCS